MPRHNTHDSQSKKNRTMAKLNTSARKRARKRQRERRIQRSERESRDESVSRAFGRYGHGSCGRKVRYDTEENALEQIERMRPYLEEGATLTTYKCHLCGGWHLTSHPWKENDGKD